MKRRFQKSTEISKQPRTRLIISEIYTQHTIFLQMKSSLKVTLHSDIFRQTSILVIPNLDQTTHEDEQTC